MAVIEVQTPDMSELKTLLNKYERIEADNRLRFGFEQFLNMLADKARLKAPVATGALQSSITYEIGVEGGKIVGVVGSNLKYAPYVELGTGVYGPKHAPIRPKNKKILAWVSSGPRPTTPAGWKAAQREGRAVFALQVRGMKARPYLLPAVNENIGKIVDFLKGALE